jgi:ankyrin repeat protein
LTSTKKNQEGYSPLGIAAANGHASAVKELLRYKGININSMNAGKSPLTLAAEHGHLAVFKLLLLAGARIDDDVMMFAIKITRNHIKISNPISAVNINYKKS